MADAPERDAHSGLETTGHEWDGIKELNSPLPRWWLWTFYATVIWAVGYWILMPAWPLVSGYTTGLLGYSQRAAVADDIAAAEAAQAGMRQRLAEADLTTVRADPELLAFAIAGGRSAFAVNCSQCHGSGAAGGPGYPNLNDDDWLWGGQLDTVYTTIRYGIRADNENTRVGEMPAFLKSGLLARDAVADVAEYVLSLSGKDHHRAAAARGKAVFAEQCAACHGDNGHGNRDLGAPNLSDRIWLYGGTREQIVATISGGRHGVMPAWEGRLSPLTVKQLAVYVHTLGGGE